MRMKITLLIPQFLHEAVTRNSQSLNLFWLWYRTGVSVEVRVILNISPSFASTLHNVNMSPDREEYWITGYGRHICSWIIVCSFPMSSTPKYCTVSVYIDVTESGRYLDSLWKYLAYCRFGLDPCVLVAERKGFMGLFISEWNN